jgi:hypothetical protein
MPTENPELDYSHLEEQLKIRKIVGLDPGKKSIIYMTTDSDCKTKERLEYTNVQRRHELGLKRRNNFCKYQKSLNLEIQQLENILSKHNSRTSNLPKFKAYLAARFSVQERLYEHYSQIAFRSWKMKTYSRKQKSEAKLIRNIKKTFGPNPIIAYGAWKEASSMKGCISSPSSSMLRLISTNFKDTIIVPEYNTSKTCSCCHSQIDMKTPFQVDSRKPNQDGDIEKLDVRGLRRCQNEKCGVLWSRDYNAAINIKDNLVHHIFNHCWNPLFASARKKSDKTIKPIERAV